MARLSIFELMYTWLKMQENGFQKPEIIVKMEELRELTRKLESNLPYLNVDFDRSSFTDMANSMMPKGYEPPSRIEWPTAEIKMMQITIKKIECFKPSDYVWEDIEKLMQKK